MESGEVCTATLASSLLSLYNKVAVMKKIGIYKITNKINNKCYIGQSKDIYKRWKYEKMRTC